MATVENGSYSNCPNSTGKIDASGWCNKHGWDCADYDDYLRDEDY